MIVANSLQHALRCFNGKWNNEVIFYIKRKAGCCLRIRKSSILHSPPCRKGGNMNAPKSAPHACPNREVANCMPLRPEAGCVCFKHKVKYIIKTINKNRDLNEKNVN